MSTVKRHWPLIGSVVVYWALVTLLVDSSLKMNEGRLVYPLDDTYIHMAVAKNVVAHHVWGVTRYEFTSSTSSPLWTVLLAATYFIFGINDWSPLVLNVFFGTLTVFVAHLFLGRFIESRLRVFAVLVIAVFATPLATLTIIGMEHVLHALLSLLFLSIGASVLSGNGEGGRRWDTALVVLAPFVVAARYEGIFLVLMVCVLAFFRRRSMYAVALGGASLLLVSIYGAWCVSHGWYFVPNSVLLKGHMPEFSPGGIVNLFGFGALNALQGNPHVLVLLMFSLFLLPCHYLRGGSGTGDVVRVSIIFIGCLLLHMQFAGTGWLFRYEAYLVLLGVVVIGIAANGLLPGRIEWRPKGEALPAYGAAIVLFLVGGASFAQRAFGSLVITPQAARNIYEQQYQMGAFLRQYYQGRTVALNDIGAVSYLADVRIVDLWGLGSLEPARLKLRKEYGTREIYDLTKERGVTIAIVYDDWFRLNGMNGLPGEWIKTGQWSIPNNVACGSDTVSLYGITPPAGDELALNMRRFGGNLPVDVAQYGEYVEKRQ